MPPQLCREVEVRLAKIVGQVKGIGRMVEENRRCPEVLAQIGAAQRALDGVARTVTRNYLERCVTAAIRSGDPRVYDELMDVVYKYR